MSWGVIWSRINMPDGWAHVARIPCETATAFATPGIRGIMGRGPISGENSRIQYCETRFNEMLRGLQEADGNIVSRDLAIALSVIHCRYARRGPTPKLPYYAYRADAASTGTIRHCIDRLQALADEIYAQKRLSPTAISIGAKYALNDIETSLPGGKLIEELVQKDHPWLAGLKLHDRFILTRGRVIIA